MIPSLYSQRTNDLMAFWGGLTAGVLDSVDAVIAFGLKGMNPIQVLQYIASGALGSEAFKGGLATAALGAALHFFIAFVVAAVYYTASRKLTALYREPTIWVRFLAQPSTFS